MATVEQLLVRIEKRLAIAPGIDVQAEAEDTLLEMLRHKYNVLFDDVWWYGYQTFETFNLDGTTGQVTSDLSSKIRRFQDVWGVFLNGDVRPLPLLQLGTNPKLFMGEALMPSPDPKKVFIVHPLDRADEVGVWYRTRIADEDWDIEKAHTTEINMDDEMLILGTVYDFLTDDASNDAAAEKYKSQYAARYQQQVNLAFQHGLSKIDQASGIPSQWVMGS